MRTAVQKHSFSSKFYRRITLGFLYISVFSGSTLYAESSTCSIDGQLSPKLTAYVQEVDALLSELQKSPSSCGGKKNSSLVSNTKRTWDVVNKAWAEIPVMGDISLDFEYNIKMSFRGESRSAVVENGKIFQRVEKSLIRGLDSLSNACNLDAINEDIIIRRLQLNHSLEALYKETALGYPGVLLDIPEEYQDVANEIRNTYNPTATQGCKNEYPFEKMSEDILNKIGSIGTGIDTGLKEWKYAIALIRGGIGIQQEKYNELKKRLLLQELNAQGFSAGAIAQMVKGYDCVESAMSGDESNMALSFAEAKAKCMKVSVLGVDRFMTGLNKILLGKNGAKTTTAYIERIGAYKNIERKSIDIIGVYNTAKAIFKEDMGTNDEMLTKLINLHITLLDINDRIEKRIPIMQKNCMKGQPGITGGCSSK